MIRCRPLATQMAVTGRLTGGGGGCPALRKSSSAGTGGRPGWAGNGVHTPGGAGLPAICSSLTRSPVRKASGSLAMLARSCSRPGSSSMCTSQPAPSSRPHIQSLARQDALQNAPKWCSCKPVSFSAARVRGSRLVRVSELIWISSSAWSASRPSGCMTYRATCRSNSRAATVSTQSPPAWPVR